MAESGRIELQAHNGSIHLAGDPIDHYGSLSFELAEGGGIEPLTVTSPKGSNLVASHLAAPSNLVVRDGIEPSRGLAPVRFYRPPPLKPISSF